jgi:hypothetical protein
MPAEGYLRSPSSAGGPGPPRWLNCGSFSRSARLAHAGEAAIQTTMLASPTRRRNGRAPRPSRIRDGVTTLAERAQVNAPLANILSACKQTPTLGELRLRGKARAGVFPVDPTRLPLRMAPVFTPPRSTTGQCGQLTLVQCCFEPAHGIVHSKCRTRTGRDRWRRSRRGYLRFGRCTGTARRGRCPPA